ncbi:hypothetical protein [Reichenbachiella ulvae]|uniref:Nitrogen regulatory protein P-II family n=1 Tax=Reichenbachiella ulvae TaxID=2980104 RepID=A0ABT3CV53_9BACT|nr:hypothetical protein [Reichenbachiella ulvae]MCV9387512.1 hypothetical protein [Reichenbachiella ulvae]
MRQVIVLSIKDFEEELAQVFSGLQIQVYSKVDIEGYKNAHHKVDVGNWFGGRSDTDFSVMFFMFVEDSQADSIMEAMVEWNQTHDSAYPVHAFETGVIRTV